MKKCTLVTLIMAVSIAILSSWCPAQTYTVTDITKQGSLLIWPKIVTAGAIGAGTDTLVMISNSYGSSVDVKCYWESKQDLSTPYNAAYSNCDTPDFQFRLTGNQPVVFSAKTGEHLWDAVITKGPGSFAAFGTDNMGLLKCWAVDASAEHQISWNFLKGEAIIVDANNLSAWEYNAYRFAAAPAQRQYVGTAGTLNLNGTTAYDACPSYILFDFLAESDNVSSDLTLVPCGQNLKQEGGSTVTKATFTIWNENEIKFTGAHQCFHCFLEWSLDNFKIPQNTGKIKPFSRARLHTNAARMRVQGLASKLCYGSGVPGEGDLPLLGLLDSRFKNLDGKVYNDKAGTNASTAGKFTKNPVLIQWDPGYAAEEKPNR